jgi:alkaline phosphatase
MDFYNNNYSVYNSLEEYDNLVHEKLFIKIGDGYAPFEYDSMISSGTLPHYLSRAVSVSETYFKNENAFIMLIEGGRIDHSGHAASIENSIHETSEFFNSAESIYNWLVQRGDYLMIITADHETGGMNVLSDNGIGVVPAVEWTSTVTAGVYAHTGRPVPVYIYSDQFTADDVSYTDDNTDIYRVVKSFIDK